MRKLNKRSLKKIRFKKLFPNQKHKLRMLLMNSLNYSS